MRGLPRLTDELPGTGGLLKTVPEDFIVEEIPAYPPSGEGDHLFLTVEKRGISTQEMVRRIARAASVPPTAIGVAGQKDQQAITRQIVSVPLDGKDPLPLANLALEGARVLNAARHRHKLRTGHLRGNRFHVVVRGVVEDALPRARAILDRLGAAWMPNYFGSQRFGKGDVNVDDGRALVLGKRAVHDRFQRRFLVSAFQAALFNRYLAERVAEGLLGFVIVGEVLSRATTSGLFRCASDELLLNQARLEQREIVPTGPMFGSRMFAPTEGSAAAAREQKLLDDEGLDAAAFERLGRIAEGTRRPLLARIDSPTVEQQADRLILSFALPPGSYATVLLDEIMK
jgi:tRNA pseudouridine13 synthase